MKTIKKSTLQTILRAFNSSSKDRTRVNINGVKLSKNMIESTDGYILTRYNLELDIDKDIILSNVFKRPLELFLKDNRHVHEFILEINDDSLKISALYSIIIPLVNREYPDTSKLVPEMVEDDYYTIKINPEFLKRLQASMGDTSKYNKGMELKISKKGDFSPIVITSSLKDTVGLLMPMRR